MEEKQRKAGGMGEWAGAVAPFILGLIVALVVGWWVFPDLMFKEVAQPVAFQHSSHDMKECADCHYLREDGSFGGLPAIETCMECHETEVGGSDAEAYFVENYAAKGQEVPWLVHQKQPDNVFFSHAAHSLASCQQMGCHADTWEDEFDLCVTCHPSVEELDKPLPYKENRLTGYSKSTMKMWECERCHANPNHLELTRSSNACFTCHK